MHGVHHPATDVDRLYALCTNGSRALQQIESTYQSCIMGWTVTFITALISSCKWYRSVMLQGPLIQSNISLLHSCRSISLRTCPRACMEVGPSCVTKSSSKRLRQINEKASEQTPQRMQNISVRAAVLFVYSPGAENPCIVSIASY